MSISASSIPPELLEGHAVSPSRDCPHLLRIKLPQLNIRELCWECRNCKSPKEPWLCLGCGKVYCGRYVNGHMREHVQKDDNCGSKIVVSWMDFSVWCYGCDNYVESDSSVKAVLEQLHKLKFGLEMGQEKWVVSGNRNRGVNRNGGPDIKVLLMESVNGESQAQASSSRKKEDLEDRKDEAGPSFK